MNKSLGITVNDENDCERVILVSDWSYSPGRRAWASAGEWAPDNPSEPELIEDIAMEWADTKIPLTDDEWDRYGEAVEYAILKHLHDNHYEWEVGDYDEY